MLESGKVRLKSVIPRRVRTGRQGDHLLPFYLPHYMLLGQLDINILWTYAK